MDLEKTLQERSKVILDSKPVIFRLNARGDQEKLSSLLSNGKVAQVVDDFEEQHKELFGINNPSQVYTPDFPKLFQNYYLALQAQAPLYQHGTWVFFSWLSTLVHLLDDADFQKVRTGRNKNLITAEEQEKFYNATVGIGGLSVGNSVALAIALQGGARHIRLADMDRLALTNLNRIRSGVQDLGLLKVEMTARQIYALNPYATVETFPEGLTPANIGAFFEGPPKLDIVIDELDNIAIKCLIREQAKKYRLAVVMAADNGDNAVVDIERYDEDPNLEFFHGRIGKVSYEELLKLDKFGIGKTITKHIGPENVTEKMQQSLLQMGKTIVSWPQLGGAALLNGSAVAYCVRQILNKEPIENNRALISLDEKLLPDYNSPAEVQKRQNIAENFKKIFGL
jgi:tRNA A37 threonylcarbamoyladenosine dehydratase